MIIRSARRAGVSGSRPQVARKSWAAVRPGAGILAQVPEPQGLQPAQGQPVILQFGALGVQAQGLGAGGLQSGQVGRGQNSPVSMVRAAASRPARK